MPDWIPDFFRWGASVWFCVSVVLFVFHKFPQATYMAVGAAVLFLAAGGGGAWLIRTT